MASKKLVAKSYRLADSRSGETFMLKTGRDGRLLAFDPKEKRERAIRHCPNEKSIFIEEQSEFAMVEPIIFKRGNLEVPVNKQHTQQFLDAHPSNVSNGGAWFEEIDDESEAEQEVEREDLIIEIKKIVRDESKKEDGIHSLIMVASNILGGVDKTKDMTMSELKRVIYSHADTNPYYFTDNSGNVSIFDDEEVQRKYLTIRALGDGVIKKSTNGRSMLWTDNKEVILTSPIGVNIVDHFADYLATDEGMLLIEEIRKRS